MVYQHFQIPGMGLFIKTETDSGARVGGHLSRSTALMQAWLRILNEYGCPKKRVSVYDGLSANANPLDLIVSIVDTAAQVENDTNSDVLICHHPGSHLIPQPDGVICLYGMAYLLCEDNLVEKYKPQFGSYIAVAPGGNPVEFWKQVDMDVIRKYPSVIIQGFTHTEAMRLIAKSMFVVSSASTSALEAVALKKNVFVVQTAEDQMEIYKGLTEGVTGLRLADKWENKFPTRLRMDRYERIGLHTANHTAKTLWEIANATDD